jgi:hypothetical protein
VEIRTAGEYKFCGQSSDGSTIKVDDEALVENEGMQDREEKMESQVKEVLQVFQVIYQHFKILGYQGQRYEPETDRHPSIMPM